MVAVENFHFLGKEEEGGGGDTSYSSRGYGGGEGGSRGR